MTTSVTQGYARDLLNKTLKIDSRAACAGVVLRSLRIKRRLNAGGERRLSEPTKAREPSSMFF
ncbi:MAG: hypothetical protein A3I05_04720 [Deltaproteobacteria bacterium RIFCSPLOWO2_02_FULL_44_10]|nr:MAG: hypothetical protein A3C46_08805 [Deltaproteobacteria bacterium RIFCSPHIGHO2_02_FULL_44_16]OGQ47011.1 MAG: hypothetical protein A3I05_04720 [Deltaproteobacteria bacterium RIFCSPLOWO2_02_FULL_44_10]